MREVVEQVRHAAALVVDDEESDVLGAVVDGEGEDVRLQGFGLAGAGGAGYEAVRAVVLLVNIEVAGDVSAAEADESAHGLGHVGFLPAGGGFEFLRTADAVHVKERQGVGDFALLLGVDDFDTPEALRELREAFGGDAVELDRRAAGAPGARVVDALELPVALDDAFALVGQFLGLPGQKHRRQAQVGAPAEHIVRNRFAVQQGRVGHEQHNPGFQSTVFGALLVAVAENLREGVEHVAALGAVGGHVADFLVARPDVGQPHGEVPRVAVDVAALVAHDGDFHVGVAVGGGDLGNHGLRDGDGGLAVLPARDSHDALLAQVDGNRHVLEHAEIFLQLAGLVGEGVVNEGEALLGDFDGGLERQIAHAQAHGEEVVVELVAVPEQRRRAVKATAFVGAEGAFAEGLRVLLVEGLDSVAHADEVLAVALEAAVLGLTL